MFRLAEQRDAARVVEVGVQHPSQHAEVPVVHRLRALHLPSLPARLRPRTAAPPPPPPAPARAVA